MDNEQLQFRTAAIGGFQKQDVLAYLEKSARDHAERVAGLEKALDAARRAGLETDDTISDLHSRIAGLEAENSRLQHDMESKEGALERAQERIQALEGQVQTQRERIEELTPAAEAYAGLRDRTAGIELEAHTRAQAIEEESRQKAHKIRQELYQWLEGMEGDYADLSADADGILLRIAAAVEQAGQELRGLTGALKQREEPLKALKERSEALGPYMPKPFVEQPPAAEPPTGPVPF